jgi:hypothetical protein
MQHAMLNSLTAADCIHALSSTTGKTPPSEDDIHAALQPGEESAHLANLFAAMPVHLEHEFTDDPTTYAEAMASEPTPQWTAALKEEFDSLHDLGVFKLVPRSSIPPGHKIMCGHPVFKLKHDQHSKPVHFKACYICQGYSAVWGQDYMKTSAPTARLESFQILIHLGAALDWEIDQLDIKTAFLHGLLEADKVCYMEQPEGFKEEGKEDWLWELQKGLYGMKQGGLIWNQTMNDAMISWGFTCLKCEHCIYYQQMTIGILLIAIHIDDFLTVGSSKGVIAHFKDQLHAKWTVSDLEEAQFCLGIALEWDQATCIVSLSQTALIDRIVTQFGLKDAIPVSTPMEAGLHLSCRNHAPSTDDQRELMSRTPYQSLVGSLMYLAIGTCLDIAHSVQQLCHHLDCYGPVHWDTTKRVVHYLKGTRDLKLILRGEHPARLLGFTDSDFTSCPDTQCSVSGYCFTLRSGLITWSTHQQKTISLSTSEAKYIAASEAAKEVTWLHTLLHELEFTQSSATPLLCNNTGGITLSEDVSYHSKVKHIDISVHSIRECVAHGQIKLHYVKSMNNAANIFTKSLPHKDFEHCHAWYELHTMTYTIRNIEGDD